MALGGQFGVRVQIRVLVLCVSTMTAVANTLGTMQYTASSMAHCRANPTWDRCASVHMKSKADPWSLDCADITSKSFILHVGPATRVQFYFWGL